MASGIAKGEYNVTVAYRYRDEIFKIFEHLVSMADMLKVREHGLKTLHKNLKTVHEATLKMTLLPNKDAAKKFAREACEANTPEMTQPNASISESSRSFLKAMDTSLSICCQNIDLRVEAASKARMEQELEVATAIQHNLLVKPEAIPEIDMSFWYQSADQIGGDWYGVFHDKEHHRSYFYIGDVTGHGAPSALMTGVICGAIVSSEFSTNEDEPVARMNRVLNMLTAVVMQTGKGKIGATMLLACVDVRNKMIHFVGAGHPFPIFISNGTAKNIAVKGSILGAEVNPSYTSQSFPFQAGDAFVMFTDGLVENMGPNERALSSKQLQRILQENHNGKAETLTKCLESEATKCWADEPHADDATVMAVVMLG